MNHPVHGRTSSWRWAAALAVSLAATTASAADADEENASEEVVVTAPAGKAPRPNLGVKLPDFGLTTHDFRFPSGLRVMFQHDPSQPVVAITAVTDHGASSDPAGREGIAHLVEHLWFRSELPHPDQPEVTLPKTWDILESEMGCTLNAFTQYDITAYMTVCGAHHLELMMYLESQRIMNTVRGVTQEMVDTEAEVVRNEIRMRTENYNIPMFTVWEYANKHMYFGDCAQDNQAHDEDTLASIKADPRCHRADDASAHTGHPYERPMAGDHESIRACEIGDIQSFTESYYTPENTTITIVGDLPATDLRYLLHLMASTFDPSLFGLTDEQVVLTPRPGIKNLDPTNMDHFYLIPVSPDNPGSAVDYQVTYEPRVKKFKTVTPPDPVTTDVGIYEAPVKDEQVVVAWTAPPAYQGNDTSLNVMAGMLSNAIFFANDKLKEAGADFVACVPFTSKQTSLVACAADVKRKSANIENIASRMIDQVPQLYATDNTGMGGDYLRQQFSRARNEQYASILNSVDTYASLQGGRATTIAQHAHFTYSHQYHSDSMREVSKLRVEEISSLAEKWLTRKRATIINLKPIDRDELAKTSSDGTGATGHARGGEEGPLLNPMMDPAKITPDYIKQVFAIPNRTKIDDFKMSNGMRVLIMPHTDAPKVRATLIVNGGTAHDTTGMLGLARSSSRRNRSLDPLQFAGSWGGGIGDTYEVVSLTGVSGNLDGILWMLRENLETVSIDMGTKVPWLKSRTSGIKRNWLESRDWHMRDMRWEHLNTSENGEVHPLNDSLSWADLEALKKASKKDLEGMLNRKWRPDNATLLIVGRLDPQQARRNAVKYFGGWRPAEDAADADYEQLPPPNPSKKRAIYIFDDEDKTQTQVQMVCPLKPTESSYSPSHQLLGAVARTALFNKLREEAGVVYSPQAATLTYPGGSAYMFMAASIQNDSAVFGLEQYLAFMDMASSGRISESDLKLKKLARANGFVLGQQSIAQMSSRLLDPIIHGEELTVWDEYVDDLANVSVDDLAEITAPCKEHAFITFSGPKDGVIQQLTDAGYTEDDFEVVDWEERGRNIYEAADPKGFDKWNKKRLKDEAKKEQAEEEAEASTDESAEETAEEGGDE